MGPLAALKIVYVIVPDTELPPDTGVSPNATAGESGLA